MSVKVNESVSQQGTSDSFLVWIQVFLITVTYKHFEHFLMIKDKAHAFHDCDYVLYRDSLQNQNKNEKMKPPPCAGTLWWWYRIRSVQLKVCFLLPGTY